MLWLLIIHCCNLGLSRALETIKLDNFSIKPSKIICKRPKDETDLPQFSLMIETTGDYV